MKTPGTWATKPREKAGPDGFTRIELLVVIAVVMLFAELFLPASARAKAVSKSGVCLRNFNLLVQAWSLYAGDNHDRLPMNMAGGDFNPRLVPKDAPLVYGWLTWGNSFDNTNHLYLTDPKYSRLAPYLNRQKHVFKCPADTFLSPEQKRAGWTERVRSVSASIGIGDGNADTGPFEPIYKHVRKMSDFAFPRPAETWVFLDEHPDSINDAAFFSPPRAAWIDQPASYHDGACNFAFADGHVAGRRWVGSLTNSPAPRMNPGASSRPPLPTRSGDPDVVWMSYHTARVSEATY